VPSTLLARFSSALAAACLLASGCGDDDPSRAETVVPPASDRPLHIRVPAGWRPVSNSAEGFAFGLPPSWTVTPAKGTTIVRSADGALALAISTDRSQEGLTTPLPIYARRTLLALPGYRGLRLAAAPRVTLPGYAIAAAGARGTLIRTGVRQAIELVALRRAGEATLSVASFRSARVARARYADVMAQLLRTLRLTGRAG
jgi:hypothetical protein